MKTVKVSDLDDFLEIGKRDWHPIHKWVYRGVPDASFGLRPVIGRMPILREGKVDEFDILNKERFLLEEFKRHAPAYSDKSPVGDLDWLCLARHYGLATRLLDWTQNPLVALFFAANPDRSAEFAVYRYWYSSWFSEKHATDIETLQKQKESSILYPRLTTERFIRQSSAFLLCHRPWEDFDSAVHPDNLTKIVFPSETRNHIRYHLRIFGVTPSFVRPDLDGLCEELNDKILYRRKSWFPLPPLEGEELDLFKKFRSGLRSKKTGNHKQTETRTPRLRTRPRGRAKKRASRNTKRNT